MAEIRVLDKHTAELIAAGEVVERPASVAKELLENAIDAGATQITLSAVRGGIQQLQIVDNGSGIEAEYIDKAFIRHATSKIATAEDLGHIHTLGFRGEALASIASVARVEVLTRTEADEYACCYRIEGGEERGMEPGAVCQGFLAVAFFLSELPQFTADGLRHHRKIPPRKDYKYYLPE